MKIFIKNIIIFLIINFFTLKFKNKLLMQYSESKNPNFKKNKFLSFFETSYLDYLDKKVYHKLSDPNKRIKIQKLCFGGEDDGIQYAINESDYGNLKFINGPKFKPIIEKIDKLSREYKNKKVLIIQIGSSNGRKIEYLAKIFRSFEFLGIDIFESVINFCNKKNKLDNLSFLKIYAHNLHNIISKKKYDLCIIFSSGSFQYVQPEHLEIFFKNMCNLKNIFLIFCEGYYKQSLQNTFLFNENSFYNNSFHFTHKYDEYAKDADFEILQMSKDEENNSCVFIAKQK